MKKFLVMACIAAASMIALPAVAQTTTGSKTQTECCKKGKADCKKECNCTDCKCKDCKATAPCCDSKAKCNDKADCCKQAKCDKAKAPCCEKKKVKT